jgi:hypothetical protein
MTRHKIQLFNFIYDTTWSAEVEALNKTWQDDECYVVTGISSAEV